MPFHTLRGLLPIAKRARHFLRSTPGRPMDDTSALTFGLTGKSGRSVRLNRFFASDALRSNILTLFLGVLIGLSVSQQVTADPNETNVPSVMVRHVTLVADGETRDMLTSAKTVAEAFAEHHLALGKHDRCSLPLSAHLRDGMRVAVTRVRVETKTECIALPFATKRRYSVDHAVGEHIVEQEGRSGEKKTTYREYFADGKRTQRVCLGTAVTPPQPQKEVHGLRGMTLASRHLLSGRRMITMRASAYGPSGNGAWGMQTATGLRPGHGVVAVDPALYSAWHPFVYRGIRYRGGRRHRRRD